MRFLDLAAVLCFAAFFGLLALTSGPRPQCPEPSARSVESLFAPCQDQQAMSEMEAKTTMIEPVSPKPTNNDVRVSWGFSVGK
jgi:hypothetical protein